MVNYLILIERAGARGQKSNFKLVIGGITIPFKSECEIGVGRSNLAILFYLIPQ